MATNNLSLPELRQLYIEQLENINFYKPLLEDARKRRHAVDYDFFERRLAEARHACRAIKQIICTLWLDPIERDELLEKRQHQVIKMSHKFTQVMLASK